MMTMDGYKLSKNLYKGTRTIVYRGTRTRDGQPVIIKVLRNPNPTFKELVQFRNQYIITRNLEHPTIVQPLALERYGNGYALVMPDDGAIGLLDYWQQSSRSLTEFLTIAIQLAEALHYLTQERIIHKDIKPANILIHPETGKVKLIDFSISTLLPKEQQQIINPNVLEGTLAYISPEQTGRMNRGIDYRTDFYSVGVTFFELLTGQLPFAKSDPMELVHCHMAQRVEFPAICEVPEVLQEIVVKLMAKNGEDRYQSALGLKYDLEKCLAQDRERGKIEPFILGERDRSDRFIIPEQLYGREIEVQTLLQAFDRVSAGATEMMLVAGFSGIGKTAVINEVHKPIVRQRGYFIKGKFDQFNRNVPFSAFVQAFRSLMGQLLGESDAALGTWKEKILDAVGTSGQVILEVIPELERIIGKQPDVAELSGSGAQNRFNLLFGKFVRVFTTIEHPLVIFLDDLQWADSASLNLLKLLMDSSAEGYLLVLGSYRDNEVFPTHPLMLATDEISKQGTTLNTLTLAPLGQPDITRLVASSLLCADEIAAPLSQLVYQKTQGNPFFTTQFLQGLYEEGCIVFDIGAGYWQYDLARVRQLALTDDVVEFMVGRLRKFPAATREVLKLAACIGNRFDLETLAVVCDRPQDEVAADLWQALSSGSIVPESETYKFFQGGARQLEQTEETTVGYRFLHDRVQQAAYALIPSHEKQENHYHIGQLLFKKIPPEKRADRIFDIVNQLNYGVDLISEQIKQDELAKLNLIACRKARSGTAYQAAIEYGRIGLKLLGRESWQREYETTLQLHELAAEAALVSGEFEAMNQWIEAAIESGKTILDKVEISLVKIQALTVQNNPLDAINCGQSVLNKFGVQFPDPVTPVELEREIEEIQSLMGDRTIEDILGLTAMENPEKLAIMKIAARMIPACYFSSSPLFPLLASLQTKLSLQYGNSTFSSTGYADYGMFMLHFKKDLATSNQFGELAYSLAASAKDKNIPAVTFVPVGLFLYHHQNHLQQTLPILQTGYQASLETGKVEYVGYHSYGFCLNSYWSGQQLTELEVQTRAYLDLMVKLQLGSAKEYCSIIWETTVFLLGNSEQIHLEIEDKDDGRSWMSEMLQSHDATRIFYFYLHRATIRFLLGEILEAKADAIQAKQYIVGGFATVCEAGFYFYDSLIILAAVSESEPSQLQQVEQNQENLRLLSEYASMNYLHKWQLVEAEKYRIFGKKYEAGDFYDRAIAGAKENGYIQEEALANELAAQFYTDWGREKIAATYMQEAYYCYARWGAKIKTDQLCEKYPQLLGPILQKAEPLGNSTELLTSTQTLGAVTSTSSTPLTASISVLDLISAIKATRAISEEVSLEVLLCKLMPIVLENAGADKGALILESDGIWEIAAQCINGNCQLSATPLDQTDILPRTIINTVKRTQQAVLINQLEKETTFANDPYLIEKPPKCLCCTPIGYQGKLIGILYLENNLATEAFTPDRLEVLKLLTAQGAISIENARLYSRLEDYSHNLEAKVSQRTEELQSKNQDLQQTLLELQLTQAQLIQAERMSGLGQMVAGIAHEINNPITFIAGNIGHARDYFQDLLDLIDLYEQNWTEPSDAILDKLEEIDLDYLRDDLEKMLGSMSYGSSRIREIVLNLRNFSRLDESQMKSVDIHEGLENTLMILQHRLRGNGSRPEIAIVKNYGTLPPVNCNASQLNQVFLHIITNAIDALTDDGDRPLIRITTEMLDLKTVRIRIADNGPGICDLVRQRIFDPFFTTKPVGQGTGLGLSISY
ncbi:MAG: AAA family ATPase, partial [Hormoscilla sp.]